MSLDPKIVKKTQDTLGKIIKKPPLTDKLLAKPPFRFLHDIMTSVIKTTGFMKGLFTDGEMNSENVKDRDSKVAFLQKAIDMVSIASKKSLSVKPNKIVAGHEPEKTNEFLQVLASAINANPDNNAIVDKVLNNAGDTAEEPKKEKSKDDRKDDRKRESRDKEERRSKDERKEKEEKREKEKDRDGKREKSRDREREEKRSDRHRDKEDRNQEKEDRHRDKEDRHRDREERHKDRERRRRHKDEDAGKENEPALMNGETEQEPPQRVARPTSAKGSRRRREGRHHASSDEEDEPRREMEATVEPSVGDGDLPPQVAASRKMGRPSSARPAPPRRKEQTMVENEPAMRLGSGKPANVIVDDGKNSDEEEDETFVVEETAPPPPDSDQEEETPAILSRPQEDGEDEDHGGLVKKILETKKDFEGPQQTKKTEIERSGMTDAQRRKQREHVQKEVDKLRSSIQTLTRSANPLGKIMDYVQEDLDSMQKELERWKTENKQHQMDLKRERGVTDKAVEPLKAQLAEVDQAIKDQLDLIAATKSNISKNDQKIEKLLQSVTRS